MTRGHAATLTVSRGCYGGGVSVVQHERGSNATECEDVSQMRYHGCVQRTSGATTRSAIG